LRLDQHKSENFKDIDSGERNGSLPSFPKRTQGVTMASIINLLDKAKDAIAAGESSYRKAADLIAQAQESGATQKQIAERLGRSRAWITFLLAWRKSGYRGSAFERSNRARVSSQTRQCKPERATAPPTTVEQVAKSEARKAEFEFKTERAKAVAIAFSGGATISMASRTQLVAALMLLGPSHPAERLRRSLGMSWDALLVPAAASDSDRSEAA
jgi:hypothetical protein